MKKSYKNLYLIICTSHLPFRKKSLSLLFVSVFSFSLTINLTTMKKLLFLLLIALNVYQGSAQMTSIVGANQGTNSMTEYPCPIQDFYYATHAQFLYLASELNAAGVFPGSVITQLGWVVEPSVFTGHLIEG